MVLKPEAGKCPWIAPCKADYIVVYCLQLRQLVGGNPSSESDRTITAASLTASCSVRFSFTDIKGQEKDVVNQISITTVSKAALEKRLRDAV